jgi:hypothetical protein
MAGKEVLRLLGLHALVLTVGLIIFALLFSTPVLVSLPLFYRGLIFIIAVLVVQIAALVSVRERFRDFFTYRDIVIAALLFSFVSTTIFMFLPVTLDRSYSVYMLGYMAEHPDESFTTAQMNEIFIDGYVNKNQAMQRRFDEQVLSKNVAPSGDGYKITSRGLLLVRIFEIVADIFSVDKRFVDPR